MDMKNRLTDKLLKVAKKHRILTYPVLALIALISVISYFFNWSTGAGKRVVAVVMVMVLLVSQSCFLTSSATEVTDETYVSQSEDEAMHSSEEIAAIIAPQFKETDIATITAIVDRYKSQDTWKSSTVFTEDSFNLLQNILIEAGELDSAVPYNDLVITDFSNKAISQ